MSSGVAIAAQLRSESWAAGVPRGATDDCASIPGIAGWALTYVQPLSQWLNDLQGDPAAISQRSTEWHRVSDTVSEVVIELDHARRALDELDGRTVRALRERHTELIEMLREVDDWSASAAEALALASTLVSACRSALCGLLSSLARISESLTALTLDPFRKLEALIEFADAAGDVVLLAHDLIETLLAALADLGRLLDALSPLVERGMWVLRDRVGRMLPIVGAVTAFPLGLAYPGYLLGTGASDLLRTDPRVTELEPDDAADHVAYRQLMERDHVGSPVDLFEGNSLIDRLSGPHQTTISVTTVRRPDGSTYAVVNLPSTQDWNSLSGVMGGDWRATTQDGGAMNDLDSNVALMVMNNPVLRTQYERAVLAALKQAGVPAGSDVVWSGFSQGGIMAGNLAADSSLPYRTVGVVVGGASIDGFDIPATVPVLQVEHLSDPVPKFDFEVPGPLNIGISDTGSGPRIEASAESPANVDWVVLPDPGGSMLPTDTHNPDNYVESLGNYLDDGHTLKNDWSRLDGTVEDVYISRSAE